MGRGVSIDVDITDLRHSALTPRPHILCPRRVTVVCGETIRAIENERRYIPRRASTEHKSKLWREKAEAGGQCGSEARLEG